MFLGDGIIFKNEGMGKIMEAGVLLAIVGIHSSILRLAVRKKIHGNSTVHEGDRQQQAEANPLQISNGELLGQGQPETQQPEP